MKKILFAALITVLLFACKNNEDNKDTTADLSDIKLSEFTEITPVFSDIVFPEEQYQVNPENENVFEHSSGTEIKVEPETFVDKNGNDVKNEVTLKYKEFRTPSDIIFNDLNMKYDSAGVKYDFQTAGMFNIEAYSNGEEVFIKKGKNIEVSFASDVPGDYNFYRYENGNWIYQEPVKAEITVKEVTNESDFVKLKPVQLDTKKDIVIDIKTRYDHIEELSEYNKVIWKYAGDLSKEEISKLLAGNVADPKIETSGKAGIYIYKFKKSNNEHSIEIAPVFTGKAYKEAVTVFNASVNQTQIPRNNIKRTVRITQLGLMNYDIISKQPDAIFVKADFYIQQKDGSKKPVTVPIFHISGNDDMIIKQKSGDRLGYSKEYKNKLVAILHGNKVAVLTNLDFDKTMSKSKGDKIDFILEPLDLKINNPDDLSQVIAAL